MNGITISRDKHKLNINLIHDFLSTAYWSEGRSRSMIETTIKNSICFGVYQANEQIGFARVVSDKAVFGYIMDVFVLAEYRGRGYGYFLMEHILNAPDLKDVQNWLLATSNANGLYQKFGFNNLSDSNRLMSKKSY